jgi:hypothetical protein
MAVTLSATPSALDNDLIDLIFVTLALMLVRATAITPSLPGLPAHA